MTTAQELTTMPLPGLAVRVLAGGIRDRLAEMTKQLDIVFETVEIVSCAGQTDYDAVSACRQDLAKILQSLTMLETLPNIPYGNREPACATVYDDHPRLNLRAGDDTAGTTGWNLMVVPEPATGLVTRAEKTRTAVARCVEFRDRLQGVMAPAAKREKEKQDRQNDTAALVFSYWQVVMGKPRAVMDPTRVTRIKARLRENLGNVSELLYAIDGARTDDWLMGRDTRSRGKSYNGIETIFRDRAIVEKLAERVGGYKRDEPHPSLKLLDVETA